mmetsp:Transcript_27845/g.69519  ORF Transcript_27845/g.69519 Transcript_27845/m.69519 type:complete len:110 (-) Transcript_27845:160-489(-)
MRQAESRCCSVSVSVTHTRHACMMHVSPMHTFMNQTCIRTSFHLCPSMSEVTQLMHSHIYNKEEADEYLDINQAAALARTGSILSLSLPLHTSPSTYGSHEDHPNADTT